ncbi:uncharacterized protein BHQ10_010392 [Talaromyces amestolkiae]|uniref:Endonuclease/exonuclease/phosphatase domain-containing protein n=1 Tax=Talaromyces amestolkiae TaxID=1196081 RepID=A0A364LEY7_TALAM|nr:uncharacterized protein BHQ10_010392 [Talaromyces amestolkiae]RAO74380.1 hypothetical protein BHQ10_010392 [Talaromyces amestolkiae]
MLGDFNLYHPLWQGTQYRYTDDDATHLIDLMDEHELEQLLPPGTVTYETNNAKTTINLIWATDHVPILTQFDFTPVSMPPVERRDWASSDWDLFLTLIGTHDWHLRVLTDKEGIDTALHHLIEAINKTAKQATPIKQITPYSQPGYTPEMIDLKHHISQCRQYTH